MEKKRDKLLSRVKDVDLEMANVRAMYSAVSDEVLNVFDAELVNYHEKQMRKTGEEA
jgi:hypothetical protein